MPRDDSTPPPFDYTGPFAAERRRMIERNLWGRGIRDERVLAAMFRVPREDFVELEYRDKSYEDHPLDIGHSQTISQPYIVAKIAELAQIRPGARALEIGAGCGYQMAVLMELGAWVCGLEIIPELAGITRERLRRLGYSNYEVQHSDGFDGWPEAAPYDAIILSAAPKTLPPPLYAQLKNGGRLVGPVGQGDDQKLIRITRRDGEFFQENLFPVRYVPMTGRARGDS